MLFKKSTKDDFFKWGDYNIIRIDIGAGNFSFKHNNAIVSPYNIDTDECSSINGNSIFLIDRELIGDSAIYIPRTYFYSYNGNDFLEDFLPDNPEIDMDGALFIPFDGIIVEEDVQNISVCLVWDLTDCISDDDGDGIYKMDDRVYGTPFDFSIEITCDTTE